MPVAIARKVEALRDDFRSAARLADLLGVNRSQVTRWLRGAGIDELNAGKVELLELVWSNLLRLYDREAALEWLLGINPHLGDRRPIDVVRAGRLEDLMRAIRAERAGSFGNKRDRKTGTRKPDKHARERHRLAAAVTPDAVDSDR
jgi:hypothetical protein